MIRRAVETDAKDILSLLLQVHRVHSAGRPDIFKVGGRKYTPEELKGIIADDERPIFVHENAEGVVDGYVFCVYEYTEESPSVYAMKTMYIDDLCVDEKLRGSHIGSALYDYAKCVAKENGCYRVTLHVWELNPGAKAFYEKQGLKPLYTAMEDIL
ncbi:MAG: GNAT family N-acetyltransferase [Lachnospiraceae bacterium]|nr:GNAT family N-acetyltransferase [Lachnospiraceae bacterium]